MIPQSSELGPPVMPLAATFNREQMARYYAQNHYYMDLGVDTIYYLPANAAPREIRFLEVNRLIPEFTDPEPIDFGVDIESDNRHSLIVFDVTPSQWRAVQDGRLRLPEGWSMEGCQQFDREEFA